MQPYRDPKLSLWQSSVRDVMVRKASHGGDRTGTDDPLVEAAAELADRIHRGMELPGLGQALWAAADLADSVLYCARLAMELAEAKVTGRLRDALRYSQELDSENDPCEIDWSEIAAEYARNLVLRLDRVPYVPPSSPGDFVIDGRLGSSASIALLGDWGTGSEQAFRVLGQVREKQPDAVIHLGGIYYSGTSREIADSVLAPLRDCFDLRRTLCLAVAGTPEMYSGGRGYYEELLPELGQPASCFCVRNDNWQIVAIDTALHDRIPGGGATYLEASEAEWLADKIENAGARRTLVLSYNPLFSAFEPIGDTFYNEPLYAQTSHLLSRISAWFWAQEHRLAVYEKMDALEPGLERGRCLGCSAVPVPAGEEPDTPMFPQVRVNERAGLGRAGGRYNHAYAIVQLDGPAAKVSYYQDTGEQAPLYEEVISSTLAAGRVA